MSADRLHETAARTAGSSTPPLLVPATRFETKEMLFAAAFVGIICLAIFSILAHSSLMWEQDQASKAAKILYMISHNRLIRPYDPAGAVIYQDAFFTFYYIVCALVYKVVGGNIFGLMNQLSAVFGAAGMIGITTAIRRAHGIPWYISLPLFLSMPIVVITFSYGNEVALSFGLFGAALATASFGGRLARFVSPVLMVLACYARADMAVVAPYWLGWTLIYGLGVSNLRDALRNTAVIGAVFALATLLYGAVVFRGHLPQSLGFGLGRTEWMLWLGNLSFPFCSSLVVVGGIGVLILLLRRRKEGLLHLLLLLPLAVYFNDLYSPKYIIVMTIFYVVPAAWLLMISGTRLRALMLAGIAFWWIFAVSNFGFFGPKQGALWYLPTADNAIPTGSYLTFYDHMRKGFYQERYDGEIDSLEKTVAKLCATPPSEPQVLWGIFNMHTFLFVTVRQGRFDNYSLYFDWRIDLKLPEDPRTRIYMIQTSYLWTKVLPPEGKAKFVEWAAEGRLREVIGDGGPFPQLIEIGPLISAGTDVELGKRLLFAREYYLGSLSMERREMIEPYATLAWVRRETYSGDVSRAVYADKDFLAFNQPVAGGRNFGLHFPKAYLRFTKEDTRFVPVPQAASVLDARR